VRILRGCWVVEGGRGGVGRVRAVVALLAGKQRN